MDAIRLTEPEEAQIHIPSPFPNDLAYIQEELRWLEARARRICAEHALQRLERDEAPAYRHRREEASPRTLLRRAQRTRKHEDAQRAALDAALATHRASDAPQLALDRLCERCGLDDLERLVLLLAVAPCFARSLEELLGKVNGEEYGSVTVEIVFAFAELPLSERIARRGIFGPRAPLAAQDLVSTNLRHRFSNAKDLLTADLEITTHTFAYVVGRTELQDEFLEFSSIEEPRARLEQVVLADADRARMLSVVTRHERFQAARQAWGFDDCIGYGKGCMMLLWGPPGTGKTMTAHGIAAHLGKRVLNVDIPTFLAHAEADRFLPGLFREARLRDAMLFFDECEALFASRARSGNALMTLLLTELERFDGVAILATNLPQNLDEALSRRILVRVHFPAPDRAQRAEIWRRHLPEQAPISPDVDVEVLAHRFELTGGLIKNAVLTAVAAAIHEAGDSPACITQDHLEAAAAAQLPSLDDMEDDMRVPQARLDDLVLAPPQHRAIQHLVAAVRNRQTILQSWGVGGPRTEQTGVAVLLHGPPGTGKTLCAEALAGELNRPLWVARAPTLVSKWVGDTERNLQRLFQQARGQRAVILLDEADSLLTRRDERGGSRHDRSMTNVLLDLIEQYPGLVVLTSNLPDQLDPALARRLAWRIRFDPPTEAERRRLWARALPDTAPTADDVDLDALARFELTGADIRTVALRAATVAAEEQGQIRQLLLLTAAREVAQEGSLPTAPWSR